MTPDYSAMDPGIVELVRALRERGWETTDSGDGVSKVGGPQDVDGNVLHYPHVAVRLDMFAFGADKPTYQAQVLHDDVTALCGPGWHVELSYSTADRVCMLFAIGPVGERA